MSANTDTNANTDEGSVTRGFATVDEKGRIALPKHVRAELGVHAGSSVAYVLLDHALLLIPQDEYLAALSQHAADAIASAGLTVEDLLDELPAARADVMREMYSPDFLRELEQMWQAQHATEADATKADATEVDATSR
jgi:AbrB family looped-hinge helix DNA binding protein